MIHYEILFFSFSIDFVIFELLSTRKLNMIKVSRLGHVKMVTEINRWVNNSRDQDKNISTPNSTQQKVW